MLARLSSKGQVVIPKAMRRALGLEAGARFRIQFKDGKIILEPLATSPVDALYAKYRNVDLLTELEAQHQRELQHEDTIRA